MQEKKCSECGVSMPLTEFGGPWNDRGKKRHDSRCKPCRKAYNKRYYSAWAKSKKRKAKTKRCRSCDTVKAVSNFSRHKGRRGGLQSECNQCRAEKQRLTIFRRQNSRSFVLPDKKTCRSCGETKPPTGFYRQTAKKDGLASSCKACLYARRNAKRNEIDNPEPTVDEKWCPGCLGMVKAEDFPRNRRAKSGLWTYCRECESDRKASYRGKL